MSSTQNTTPVLRNSSYYANILISFLSWPGSTLSKTYDFLDMQENKIKDRIMYSFFLQKKDESKTIIRLDIYSYYDPTIFKDAHPWAYLKHIIDDLPKDQSPSQILTLPQFNIINHEDFFTVKLKINNMVLFELKKAISVVRLKADKKYITVHSSNATTTTMMQYYLWVN